MAIPEIADLTPGLAVLELLLGQASTEGIVGVMPGLAVGRGEALQTIVAGPGVIPTTPGTPTTAFGAGDNAAFGVVLVPDTTGLGQTPRAIAAGALGSGFRNGMAGIELDRLQQVAGKVVFGISLWLLMVSMALSFYETVLSNNAIQFEIDDIVHKEKTPKN